MSGCCIVAWPLKGSMFDEKHLQITSPTFCSGNDLGSAGAEELVKASWPELRRLDIRWEGLAWRDCACCGECKVCQLLIIIILAVHG